MMNKLFYLLLLVSTFTIMSCQEKATTETKEISKSAVKSTAVSKSVTSHTNTGEMSWHSMSDVESLVKKEKKKILVDVYTQWCGPCKMMDRNTFTDAAVQKAITEKFYPVKFDAEGPGPIDFQGKTWENPNHDPNKRGRNSRHQLASFFAVPGYPTLVVLDENFNVLRKIVGYKTPDKLLAEIETI